MFIRAAFNRLRGRLNDWAVGLEFGVRRRKPAILSRNSNGKVSQLLFNVTNGKCVFEFVRLFLIRAGMAQRACVHFGSVETTKVNLRFGAQRRTMAPTPSVPCLLEKNMQSPQPANAKTFNVIAETVTKQRFNLRALLRKCIPHSSRLHTIVPCSSRG